MWQQHVAIKCANGGWLSAFYKAAPVANSSKSFSFKPFTLYYLTQPHTEDPHHRRALLHNRITSCYYELTLQQQHKYRVSTGLQPLLHHAATAKSCLHWTGQSDQCKSICSSFQQQCNKSETEWAVSLLSGICHVAPHPTDVGSIVFSLIVL